MIYEWKSKISTSGLLGIASPNAQVLEDEFIQAFGSLEVQTLYSVNRKYLEHEGSENEAASVLQKMPKEFATAETARIYLELILRTVENYLFILRANALRNRELAEIETEKEETTAYHVMSGPHIQLGVFEPQSTPQETIQQERIRQKSGEHLKDILRWKSAVEPLIRNGETASTVLLQMQAIGAHFCVIVLLQRSQDEEAINEMMTDVVNLARRFLEDFERGRKPRFSLSLGIILPLYILGMKCRAQSIRREMVRLLISYPRREGLWDSVMAGKIIQWSQEMEEEYLDDGEMVPLWAKIHIKSIVFDLHERRAHLSCFQRVSPETSETRERHRRVSW